MCGAIVGQLYKQNLWPLDWIGNYVGRLSFKVSELELRCESYKKHNNREIVIFTCWFNFNLILIFLIIFLKVDCISSIVECT